MKKNRLAFIALLLNASVAMAGGILTNTNQSVHFLRNPARDASTEIDAAYTNPAGLTKLKHDGFHFSFNNQSAFQTRTITSTFSPYYYSGGNTTKEFEGKASAPIIPSLQGAYKKGKWVLSGAIAVSGGGGKATFNNGLPSFEAGMSMLPVIIATKVGPNVPGGMTANKYSVDAYMKGSSFIYGAQLGGSYEINEMFSVYGGFRLNIVNNGYEGYLRNLKSNPTSPAFGYDGSMIDTSPIIDIAISQANDDEKAMLGLLKKASTSEGVQLDCDQSGWGVSPIVGFNFSYGNLNIGAKYEFKTSLDVENNTKKDDTGMFKDGVNTPHDIPALLTIGASYKIIPQLTANIGYHHFFDSDAGMADGKEKHAGASNEYLAGLEFQIDRMFMVSAGGQITRYGVKDEYQKDLSFSCDSYSIGFGGAVNVSPTVKINIGYFWTTYSDYTKEPGGGIGSVVTEKDVFSRTNKVFGAGVDFRF
ncbi:aromatic hydrocarbon degradation protein [Dysgonomonas sp. 216]|uniref:OmpP1/FadL family transporter n=1 Tax=Dysgonomonas sp. 216 TaxID=2302934 RepID=UPI0013D7BD3A|nr:aromatic hydrocarbon degradation protein [Dysgonomonas sp. 216]NDW17296.1 aromatic hydrocarbon degradation protein [Dysgonomonas sp. 216]